MPKRYLGYQSRIARVEGEETLKQRLAKGNSRD